GTMDLSISDVFISSGDTDQFNIIAPSVPCDLAPGESSNFTIIFSPTDSLYHSATVKVVSDDPDEGTYTFMIDGIGSTIPVPDIQVMHGSIEMPDVWGVHYFGWVEDGDTNSAVFTVENNGTDILNITNISIIDVTSIPGEFIVSPTSINVSPGTSQTLTVTFLPISSGDKEAIIKIDSNDPDEVQYTFTIKGTGFI
ncbi:MAG: choice-of-anchor D domain-containing protein, partial [Candidatus Kariarchaeaceae archaeon]